MNDVPDTEQTTEPAPDLAALEKIEGELFAVERALEQIDKGVYVGFAGLEGQAPA